MLFLATFVAPSLCYSYGRGQQGLGIGARSWMPSPQDSGLLGDYVRGGYYDQYGGGVQQDYQPPSPQEYQPSPRYTYGAPRPRINKVSGNYFLVIIIHCIIHYLLNRCP